MSSLALSGAFFLMALSSVKSSSEMSVLSKNANKVRSFASRSFAEACDWSCWNESSQVVNTFTDVSFSSLPRVLMY